MLLRIIIDQSNNDVLLNHELIATVTGYEKTSGMITGIDDVTRSVVTEFWYLNCPNIILRHSESMSSMHNQKITITKQNEQLFCIVTFVDLTGKRVPLNIPIASLSVIDDFPMPVL